jgi:hypothetical protein
LLLSNGMLWKKNIGLRRDTPVFTFYAKSSNRLCS